MCSTDWLCSWCIRSLRLAWSRPVSTTTNSSPPTRYTGLCLNTTHTILQASRMYSSPALWPRVSLIFFRPFTSHTTTANSPARPEAMAASTARSFTR